MKKKKFKQYLIPTVLQIPNLSEEFSPLLIYLQKEISLFNKLIEIIQQNIHEIGQTIPQHWLQYKDYQEEWLQRNF
jgi:hypothetical protein